MKSVYEIFLISMLVLSCVFIGFSIEEENELIPSFILSSDKYYILEFSNFILDNDKNILKSSGVDIISYYGNNSFLIKMDKQRVDEVIDYEFVKSVNRYKKNQKETLIKKSVLNQKTFLFNSDKPEMFIVQLFDESISNLFENEVLKLGGIVISNSSKRFIISIDKSKIDFLNKYEEVMFISNYSYNQIFNYNSKTTTNVYNYFNYFDLYGEDQIVAVSDTGLDIGVVNSSLHGDFLNKNVFIYDYTFGDGASDEWSGHGTHVAGSVLGTGVMSGADLGNDLYNGTHSGMAPKADLYFQALEFKRGESDFILQTPIRLDLYMFGYAYDYGARIHSNSWGSISSLGSYTSDSLDVDTFLWNYKDYIILFAAGNCGATGDSSSCQSLGVNTISSPSTAKNTITVGASVGDLSIAGFSSVGPTNDGRIKPDLVAPGSSIISTRSSVAGSGMDGNVGLYYELASGTSMATPITAGIVTLVREYLIKNKNITSPTSSLIKAMLINGAKDITGDIPDMNQGWGMVDLNKTLYESYDYSNLFFESTGGLLVSESYWYNFSLATSGKELEITLVWTDYPGTATGNGTELVNNLDLVLVTPELSEYNGNDFNTPYDDSVDNINNVEGIRIDSASSGNYMLKIIGSNIPVGPQPFSFVISSARLGESINILNPVENSNFDNDSIIFNISTTDQGNLALISFDNGSSNFTMNMVNSTFFNYEYDFNDFGNFSASIYFNDSSNEKFKMFETSFSINEPMMDLVLPKINSIINQSSLQVDYSLNFTKLISNVYYFNGTQYVDYSTSLNGNWLNISLNMSDYGDQNNLFRFTDIYGINSSRNVTFKLNLLPELNPNSPLNDTEINVSRLNFDINVSFNKNITTLNYLIDGYNYNITDLIDNSKDYMIIGVDSIDYSNKTILFSYTGVDSLVGSYELFLSLNLNLGGNLTDFDNDGINDSLDRIIGNQSNVLTTFDDFIITINLSTNLTKKFKDVLNISFENNSVKIVEFEHNFSNSIIDLTKISIKSKVEDNISKIFFNGIVLGELVSKTVYLKLEGDLSKSQSLCLKDIEVVNFEDISNLCDGDNETFVSTIPASFDGYDLSYTDSSNSTVKISGLKHSGISQMCSEDWSYSDWSTCSSSSQFRTATDLNSCGTEHDKDMNLTGSCVSSSTGSSSGGGSSGGGSSSGGGISGGGSSVGIIQIVSDDNDTINDVIDNIELQETIIFNSNSSRFNFIVDSIDNVDKKKANIKTIGIFENNVKLVSFSYDFTDKKLDLSNVEIIYNFTEKSEIVLKKFFSLNLIKDVYMKNNLNLDKICIKDMEVESVGSITNNCLGDNEYLITCDSEVYDGFSCNISEDYYVVSGLTKTALIEADFFMIKNNKHMLDLIKIEKNQSLNFTNNNEIFDNDKVGYGVGEKNYVIYLGIVMFFVLLVIIKIVRYMLKKKE